MGIEGIEQLSGNDSAGEFVVTKSNVPLYPDSANSNAFKCNPDESLGQDETPDEDE